MKKRIKYNINNPMKKQNRYKDIFLSFACNNNIFYLTAYSPGETFPSHSKLGVTLLRKKKEVKKLSFSFLINENLSSLLTLIMFSVSISG